MGAAYTCVAFTSLVASIFFRNPEAAATLILQSALLSMLGCIVRPHVPLEFYKDGARDSVQNSQMIAVVMGWVGGLVPIVALLLKENVPSPCEALFSMLLSLFSSSASKGGAAEEGHEAKPELEVPNVLVQG